MSTPTPGLTVVERHLQDPENREAFLRAAAANLWEELQGTPAKRDDLEAVYRVLKTAADAFADAARADQRRRDAAEVRRLADVVASRSTDRHDGAWVALTRAATAIEAQGDAPARCSRCGWPLDPSGVGCRPGDCSQRPPPPAQDSSRQVPSS